MQFLTSIFIVLNLFFAPHDYHVGIFEIEFKNQQVEITQKVFADDFKKALMLKGNSHQFGDDLNEENISRDIQEYINEHFVLYINGKALKLNYVGAEWEDYHAFYLYWESMDVPEDLSLLEIQNSIFLEVSSDQQNMHRVRKDGKEYEVLLDRSKTKGSITF